MEFERFGITLARLESRHLEVVRQWRNGDWVRPLMRFQEVIEPWQQRRWFSRLEPAADWYFCVHVGALPFGLFHVKAIDWTTRTGEAGGFVGDPRFIGRPEPALATLALMDFAFSVLELHALEAQYRKSLPKVVRYNDQLGYQVFSEEADFVRARVTRERYFACAETFREAAALYGEARASVAVQGGARVESGLPDAGPTATSDR